MRLKDMPPPEELKILGMYKPNVFTIEMQRTPERESLVAKGLIEWEPAPTWMGPQYKLTEAGRKLMGFK